MVKNSAAKSSVAYSPRYLPKEIACACSANMHSASDAQRSDQIVLAGRTGGVADFLLTHCLKTDTV